MKELKKEILRSKQLMGLSEGLNLPKRTPVTIVMNFIKDLIVNIDNPDTSDPIYLSYYDKNGRLVLDENIGGKHQKGWWSISFEEIYHPLSEQLNLLGYDALAPVIKNALENIFNKPVNFIHNVSKIELKWYRKYN